MSVTQGEFPESRIVSGCSELAPLGRFRLALVSWVRAAVAVVTSGAGGGVETIVVGGGVWP